jgi:galactokinase/mevalonate kinase-like predicted kinase
LQKFKQFVTEMQEVLVWGNYKELFNMLQTEWMW